MTQARAVFLDRDGVINRATIRNGIPHSPSRVEQLEILPGVKEALLRLRAAGFRLVVVTNQPDVARGRMSRESVESVNAVLSSNLAIDEFRVCFHDDADDCRCRKPRHGMITDAARDAGINIADSYLVGDRWRDIEAGKAAGCATILVDAGHSGDLLSDPDIRVASLSEAADWILARAPAGWQAHEAARVKRIEELNVKIFADGADRSGMLDMYARPYVKGFTTNPTLMRKAGIGDYRSFAKDVLSAIPDRPISFEVFSDEIEEMERQAREIAGWGENVYVKIPVTNTRRESCDELVRRLSHSGVKVNVTALMSLQQVQDAAAALTGGAPACVSVFAGRIADSGRDPVPLMAAAVQILRHAPNSELVWASPRELLNVFQADAIGCQIITVTNDILNKIHLIGKDLAEFSLDTVKMFRDDAVKAGFSL